MGLQDLGIHRIRGTLPKWLVSSTGRRLSFASNVLLFQSL